MNCRDLLSQARESARVSAQRTRPVRASAQRLLRAPPYRHGGDRGKTIAQRIGLRGGYLMAVMHARSTPQCNLLAETP